ncbi:MAG: hypothetical protein IJ301_02785 [Clostridia bacterium]|nr:hypothetical protein [Clostridia bacterium]
MKTKLFGKMTLLAFVLMVTFSFGLMSPMLLTMASGLTTITTPSQAGYIIEVTNYQSSFDIDELDDFVVGTTTYQGFAIPTAKINGQSTEPTLIVTNSAGVTVAPLTADSGDNSGKKFIAVSGSDTYTFTYSADNGTAKTTTRDIKVTVTANEAKFEFDSNSKQIMPTVVQAGDIITFPMPKVMVGEDEVTGASVSIKLEGPSGDISSQLTTVEGFKTYTVASTDAGTYTVTYTYNNNGTNVVEKKTFNVVTKRPDVTLAYDGYSSAISSLSMSVGNEVTLPTPKVVNKEANNAVVDNVYTEITVENITNTSDTYEKISDFKFTPKENGNFKFTYKTVDFAGNEHSEFFFVNYVTKSGNSIEVKVVNGYDVANVATMNIEELENADYMIPTKLFKKSTDTTLTVNFPAIYAEGGWGDYDNLKLTRAIYQNNSRIATLENETKADGTTKYTANEVVPYEFDFTNTTSSDNTYTYTIRYEACYVDDEGNVISGTTKQLPSYTLEIVTDDDFTSPVLTVKAPSMVSTVRAGKTVTFGAPTITDLKSSDSNEVVDTRVKLEVSYYFDGNSGDATTITAKDGIYSIEVDKPNGYSDVFAEMNVVFKATDDINATPVEVTKTISIVDYSDDITAPQQSSIDFSNIASDKDIVLPTIEYTDDLTDIRLIAYVINEDGKVVDFINATTSGDKTASIEGATFTPNIAGKYIVTVVATDQNNNTSTFSINYDVDFNNGYSVTIESIDSQEYGNVINLLDKIHVYDNKTEVDLSTMNVKFTTKEVAQADLNVLTANDLLVQIKGKYMTPASDRIIGEIITLDDDISVRAWAAKAAGAGIICDYAQNGSAKVTFSSADTVLPTFTIENEALDNTNYEWDSAQTNTYTLPWFKSIADNGSGVDESTMKITLTYQGDSEKFKEITSSADLTFTATKQGKVNAVYSVSDNTGNVSERTFVLNIGDVTPPEIILEDDAVTAPEKAVKDGTLVIDLSKIDIEETESSLDADDLTIVITRDGENIEYEVKDNTITIDASIAGKYVVTFDVKDAAHNQAQQVVKTFTVASAASNTGASSSTVWGTVLIVVSLIVLGLVIFFFVKPSKTSKPTTSLKVNKDDDKKTK